MGVLWVELNVSEKWTKSAVKRDSGTKHEKLGLTHQTWTVDTYVNLSELVQLYTRHALVHNFHGQLLSIRKKPNLQVVLASSYF